MKWVLALGALAWAVRYGLFAIGRPLALLILGVALHGVCFNFFFTAGAIHVENAAQRAVLAEQQAAADSQADTGEQISAGGEQISARAQSLFVLVTYGVGMTIGAIAAGWLNEMLTREVTDPETGQTVKVTNWPRFWLVPGAIALVSFVLLVLFLRV
jgi:hypothetical protein